MARQYFMDMLAEPPLANLTAVTATSETALWSAATYTPIPALDANRPGKAYMLKAGGIMSFASTGSLTITPRAGLTVAANTLGASSARTSPGATTNQPWFMEMICVIRTTGTSGTMVATGGFQTNGTATLDVSASFGGTSATFDTTVASGVTIGWTLSVAGTITPMFVTWQAMN